MMSAKRHFYFFNDTIDYSSVISSLKKHNNTITVVTKMEIQWNQNKDFNLFNRFLLKYLYSLSQKFGKGQFAKPETKFFQF